MPDFILHINHSGIQNKSTVRNAFAALTEGKYLVRVEAFKKRSLPQNAYYWGIVVPMVKQGLKDIGYNEVKTNEDAHEIMKHIFLKKPVKNEINGDEIVIAGSTADLKTVAFNAFLEEVWQWAAEYLNIQIPAPNEQAVMFQNV